MPATRVWRQRSRYGSVTRWARCSPTRCSRRHSRRLAVRRQGWRWSRCCSTSKGLSDRQAAEQVRARKDWKYLLALELDDPGFDCTVFTEFRARLIQQSIFELRTPVGATLRTELRDTCYAALDTLGFRPALDTVGPVESAVPDDIVPELISVLREALSNVARHARARSLRVSVRVAGQHVILQVQDDGFGLDPNLARGGVVNMSDRADDLGGTFKTGPGPDGAGANVTWRVPLPH